MCGPTFPGSLVSYVMKYQWILQR